MFLISFSLWIVFFSFLIKKNGKVHISIIGTGKTFGKTLFLYALNWLLHPLKDYFMHQKTDRVTVNREGKNAWNDLKIHSKTEKKLKKFLSFSLYIYIYIFVKGPFHVQK